MASERVCPRCGKPWPVAPISRSMERLRLTQRGWQPEGDGWVCPTCLVPFTDDAVGSDAEFSACYLGRDVTAGEGA